MYVIICDARKGSNMGIDILFLVDRQKSKKFWWTSDNWNIMMKYRNKEAAEYTVERLKRNRATVVTLKEAKRLFEEQQDRIADHEADCDLSWDAHKGGF